MYGGAKKINIYIPEFPMPEPSVPVTIYYLSWCPACGRALEALRNFRDNNGNPMLYATYDAEALMTNMLRQKKANTVDEDMLASEGRQLLYKKLDKLTKGYRYFPMVFVRGKFIGGSTDLIKFLKKLTA